MDLRGVEALMILPPTDVSNEAGVVDDDLLPAAADWQRIERLPIEVGLVDLGEWRVRNDGPVGDSVPQRAGAEIVVFVGIPEVADVLELGEGGQTLPR